MISYSKLFQYYSAKLIKFEIEIKANLARGIAKAQCDRIGEVHDSQVSPYAGERGWSGKTEKAQILCLIPQVKRDSQCMLQRKGLIRAHASQLKCHYLSHCLSRYAFQ